MADELKEVGQDVGRTNVHRDTTDGVTMESLERGQASMEAKALLPDTPRTELSTEKGKVVVVRDPDMENVSTARVMTKAIKSGKTLDQASRRDAAEEQGLIPDGDKATFDEDDVEDLKDLWEEVMPEGEEFPVDLSGGNKDRQLDIEIARKEIEKRILKTKQEPGRAKGRESIRNPKLLKKVDDLNAMWMANKGSGRGMRVNFYSRENKSSGKETWMIALNDGDKTVSVPAWAWFTNFNLPRRGKDWVVGKVKVGPDSSKEVLEFMMKDITIGGVGHEDVQVEMGPPWKRNENKKVRSEARQVKEKQGVHNVKFNFDKVGPENTINRNQVAKAVGIWKMKGTTSFKISENRDGLMIKMINRGREQEARVDKLMLAIPGVVSMNSEDGKHWSLNGKSVDATSTTEEWNEFLNSVGKKE